MAHWRKQQSRDPFFRRAKADGYRARSAYKLLQLQEKFHLIRRGDLVVDLGAAPGSWSQVAVELVGRRGRVIALDIQPMAPIPGVLILQGDMTAPSVQAKLREIAGRLADVVLSDAAPSATGIRLRDHVLSVELGHAALTVARTILRPGGKLVTKVFNGEDLPPLVQAVKRAFHPVRLHKPEASRRESRELFIIALGFKG